ncbi:TIGR03808 family TAT-translocated repetitive protein [Devosia sp.]|uniref:TIGR03808 family TAT-translocated repetitive protein n=1 Tax=Devosia sp. TaxID=1871048 RepID=UPI003BA8822E
MSKPLLNRRRMLAGLAAAGALPLAAPVLAQALGGNKLGLVADSPDDQSAVFQEALIKAATDGRPLFVPPGTYLVGNLQVPSNLTIEGVPGDTILASAGAHAVLRIAGSAHVRLTGLSFLAAAGGPDKPDSGLVEIEASSTVDIEGCSFQGGLAHGIVVREASARIAGCEFSHHGLAAIFSTDSRGLDISGNHIMACSNGGILIWGSKSRHDGSIVSGNTISGIGWTNGGNGQNGNGINVYRCDDVIVSDNQISDCAFSAVRLNSTKNVSVTGNVCRKSGEVAIFSEFAFSGSVIANNIIDGAATGISITNLDQGGRLAVCSGNLVRNISASSAVNPDTRPVGIYAEADTVVASNTIDNVPGIGILAGNGPFLSNVAINANTISGTATGIAVSTVHEAQTGKASVSNNLISGSTTPIAGRAWDKVTSTDLAADAAQFPNITLSGNIAS